VLLHWTVSLGAILLLGFLLGMRHATDADHVVAVSTIVSRQRSVRSAAPIGALWGAGHSVTVMLVGGAIILFGLVIPTRVGLTLELAVGAMLVGLGAYALLRDHPAHDERPVGRLRSFCVGVVHGLAGSAAAALLVLGTIRDPRWATAYLAIFAGGTIVGMSIVTMLLALPFALAMSRLDRVRRTLTVIAGAASVALGVIVLYDVGIAHGLFTSHPQWTPR